MINKIRHVLGLKPNHFPDSKTVIEYAFTCGGVDYYQHVDEMNMPYRRALKVLSVYKELESSCDKAFLKSHVMAMNELFGGKKVGFDQVAKMKQLNDQLNDRLELVVTEDAIYKLASVRFFDGFENPTDYDYKYNEKKIAHWKQHEPAHDFFLREPIARLIPFLKSAPVDLESYLQAANQLIKAQSDTIWEILSPSKRTELSDYIERLSSGAIAPKKPL